jgi:hypothetical protein
VNRLKLWRWFCGLIAFFVSENALGRNPMKTLREDRARVSAMSIDEALDICGISDALAPLSGYETGQGVMTL